MRRFLSTLAASSLLAAGCSYDFKNPAEKLESGQVAGRVVADVAGDGRLAGIGGVQVKLRNSSFFSALTTRENGRYIFLGLPPGVHTVLFSKGTEWSTTREIEVTWGKDGQPEGVILGDVQAHFPIAIGGTFSVPSVTFVPAIGGVVVYDEATGLTANVTPFPDGLTALSTFTYSFPTLPVGPHRLRFVAAGHDAALPVTYLFGPFQKDVGASQEGQTISLTPFALSLPPAGAVGTLKFKVVAPPALKVGTDVTATLTPAPVGVFGPDSTGTYQVDVAPGAYSVGVTLSALGAYALPPSVTGIVMANQITDLGNLYVTDDAVTLRASGACLADADCGTGACVSGLCVAPCATGADTSPCLGSLNGCSGTPPSGFPVQCANNAGRCAQAPDTSWVCVPTGLIRCTYGAGTVDAPFCGQPF